MSFSSPSTDHVVEALVSKVGVNSLDAIPNQQTEVMHFTWLSRLSTSPTRVRVPERMR